MVFIPSISFSFSGKGSGTVNDPYQITNINQLQDIRDDDTSIYVLMNDIDASDTRNWNIGDHDNNPNTPDSAMGFKPLMFFRGLLNGNGFILKNLYINRPLQFHIGLFGYVIWGTIKNLGIENCYINGECFVGALCGECENGCIEECYTTGNVFSSLDNEGNIAGFCGFSNLCCILNCYSECYVASFVAKYDYSMASFTIGVVLPTNNATNCYSIGKVKSNKLVSVFGPQENADGSYWDIETTGVPDTIEHNPDYLGNYAKGLTTKGMMIYDSIKLTWDNAAPWYLDEGKDYPRLKAFKRDNNILKVNNSSLANYEITISPNPASDYIEITGLAENENWEIFNVLGEKMMVGGQTGMSNLLRVDVSAFPQGVYFLRAGGKVNKFIKLGVLN